MPGPWDFVRVALGSSNDEEAPSVKVTLPDPKPVPSKTEEAKLRKKYPKQHNQTLKDNQTGEVRQENWDDPSAWDYVKSAAENFVRGVGEGVGFVGDAVVGPVAETPEKIKGLVDLVTKGEMTPPKQELPVTEAVRDHVLDPVFGEDKESMDPLQRLVDRFARLGGEFAVPLSPVTRARALPHAVETVAGAGGALAGGEIAEDLGIDRSVGEILGGGAGVVAPSKWVLPVKGRVSSGVGARKAPRYGASTNHGGVDIPKPVGTPVVAPTDLTVTKVGRGHKARGNWVEATDAEGNTHRFLHLDGYNVKPGATIKGGQPFARSGNTGRTTGPHLHWSVFDKDGNRLDPIKKAEEGSHIAPDGLPGNQSVRPIAPEEIARIMDDMEAIGDTPTPKADDELVLSPEAKVKASYSDEEWARLPNDVKQASLNLSDKIGKRYDSPLKEPQDPLPSPEAVQKAVEMGVKSLDELTPNQWQALEEAVADEVPNNVVEFPDQLIKREDEARRAWDEMTNTLEGSVWDHRKGTWVHRDKDGVIKEPLEDTLDRTALTPAERQAMDASVPKDQVPSLDSSHEKFVSRGDRQKADEVVVHKGPANDTSEGDALARGDLVGGGRGTPIDPPRDGGGNGGSGSEPPGRGPDPGYEGLTPEQKLTKAIKEAKPLSAKQRAAYHKSRAERAEKLANLQRAGHDLPSQLKALKGEMPKVDFEPIGHNFTPEDRKWFKDYINSNNYLQPFEKVNALKAIEKIFGEAGLKIPTKSEIQMLSHIFPEDMIEALLNQRNLEEKMWDLIGQAANLPRALMASADLSAPLRQGVFMIGRSEFWKSLPTMFKTAMSKDAFDALQLEIKSRPTADLMRRAKLAITDTGAFMNNREEAFMSNLAEKIPGIGKVVSASNRAYTGFLIKLRADVFDSLIELGTASGKSWETNPKALKDLGKFINAATGRGGLWKLEEAAIPLSTALFSPRLMSARLTMLNPYMYAKYDPFVRKQALKSLASFSAIASTVLGLAALGGADVETDPRSSDFGKIKVGNTRYDILGGFQQYIVLGARLWSGERKAANGGTIDLTSGKYGADTRRDTLVKFIINKFSPTFAYFSNALEGKNPIGEEFHAGKDALKSFIPLVAQDIADMYKEKGFIGALQGFPAIFGVGVQTYETKPPKPKKSSSSEWDFVTDGSKKDEWDF